MNRSKNALMARVFTCAFMVIMCLTCSLYSYNEYLYHDSIGFEGMAENFIFVTWFFILIGGLFITLFAGNLKELNNEARK